MALQFDSSGIVNIPSWIETGDFSIQIPDATFDFDASGSIILGRQSANSDFIACVGNSVTARIAGSNISTNITFVDGEALDITLVRVGVNVTLTVNADVSNASTSNPLTLDVFGAYNSNQLIYGGVIGGIVTMSGDNNNTRTYDFDQPVLSTNLPDTSDSQDGTLSNFTTGGFLPPPSSDVITITMLDGFAASDFFCKQRDGLGQATIVVAGTYTGTPTTIEYQFGSGGWTTLDAAPSGGAFSGNVTVTNQQDLSVRFGNDLGVTDSLLSLTAAACIAAWWQSNEGGRGSFFQPINVGVGNPIPVMYKSGGFLELADPVNSEGAAGGSTWPRIAQQYSDAGIPICVGNVAIGGTSITQWQPAGANYIAIQGFATACQGLEFTVSLGGETDSLNGMSTNDMITNLTTTLTALNAEFGTDHYLTYFPVGSGTGTAPNIANIRAAFDSVISNNAFVRNGGDTSVVDISDGDGVHFKTDAHLEQAADIRYTAFNSSALNVTTTGVPDGVYNAVLWDDAKNIIFNDVITVSSDSFLENIEVSAGTLVRGAAYDNVDPSTLGMWIQGVTV